MIYKTVPIRDGNLTLFIHENSKEMNPERKRPLILICPGGGYCFCCNREADPVAIRFLSFDYNVAVLRYTVNSNNDPENPIFPKPQMELADSIAYIREHANELNTNPDMIAVMGFSAGGHLAASVGCLWNKFNKNARPDALILCYALTTQDDWVTKQLFGNKEVRGHGEWSEVNDEVAKWPDMARNWLIKMFGDNWY